MVDSNLLLQHIGDSAAVRDISHWSHKPAPGPPPARKSTPLCRMASVGRVVLACALLQAGLAACALAAGPRAADRILPSNSDPFFPAFHVRPPNFHNNDPNGPFYFKGVYHLFMQYTPPGMSVEWGHFTSTDLAFWTWRAVAIASDGDGCPDTGGVFTGSATVSTVNGTMMPTLVFPGVHKVPKSPTHPDGIGMAQCMARPVNLSDPLLLEWRAQVIVPTDPVPAGVMNHFHDDSAPFKSASDGRWYMFVSGGSTGSEHGVNLLYSISDEDYSSSGLGWQQENFLWNITSGQCNFVSCPEMYSLPSVPDGEPWHSATVVYEAFCGCDRYWLGSYDDGAHTFAPDAGYDVDNVRLCYDYGVGKAGKSFWDPQTKRRILWNWVTGGKHSASSTWDGSQTVPRAVTRSDSTTSAGLQELAVNPIAEVNLLRDGAAVIDESPKTLAGGENASVLAAGNQVDISVNVTWPSSVPSIEFDVNVFVDAKAKEMSTISFTLALTSAQYMPNTNLPKGDNVTDDFTLNSTYPWTDQTGSSQCSAFCDAHPECTGWTYVRPHVQGGPRCAIKGVQQTLPPVPDSCCVSGYKQGHGVPVKNSTAMAIAGDDGAVMPAHVTNEKGMSTLQLRIFVDHYVVEVYDGIAAMTYTHYASNPAAATGVQLANRGEVAVSASMRVFRMQAAVIVPAESE